LVFLSNKLDFVVCVEEFFEELDWDEVSVEGRVEVLEGLEASVGFKVGVWGLCVGGCGLCVGG